MTYYTPPDGWHPLCDFDPKTFEEHYVWLLYDFPGPKGLTAVEGMYRSGRFWGRTVTGWWGPERIMENGRPTNGMWVDGWIKGWRSHLLGPGEFE
jgi:hypothetical protein